MSATSHSVSIMRNAIRIEKRTTPPREEFEREYFENQGTPVILTDACCSWPAIHKWTFGFFSARFGQSTVLACDQLLAPKRRFRMTFADFLTHCQSGNWDLTGAATTLPSLYFAFQPFSEHPDLLDDFSHPPVVQNIYQEGEPGLYSWYVQYFGAILIGSRNALTPIHADLFGTHAWLAQLQGRKRWLLFPPEDAASLCDESGMSKGVPPNTHPHEAVLFPGETIFVPQGWYHRVVCLDPSISLTFNFVNKTNFQAHILGICRDLPQWVKRISAPGVREHLAIRWSFRDFDFLAAPRAR